jgi:hypothetical protein
MITAILTAAFPPPPPPRVEASPWLRVAFAHCLQALARVLDFKHYGCRSKATCKLYKLLSMMLGMHTYS